MASLYSSGQYEDSYRPDRLQNWGVTRPGQQRPSQRKGSTLIIANDRGHLLPTVPRPQASPWGTFLGTWDMPLRIPPARLDLTSRSAATTARLMHSIRQPTALTRACNGLRTEFTGKPQEPWSKEPSRRSSLASSEDIQLEAPPSPRAGTGTSLSHQHSHTQLKADASPEPPPCCQHWGQSPRSCQPPDLQHRDPSSPGIPAAIPPTPREVTPLPSRGGSAGAEPRGYGSPGRDGERLVPGEALQA